MLHESSKSAEERTQWLIWVDGDSILINPAISPCTFLSPDTSQNVFVLVTANYQELKNGIFYLRVRQSLVDLLTPIVDYPLAHPDEDLGWFGEQAAMETVTHPTETRLKDQGSPPGIAWVPRTWFNTFEFEHGFEGQPGHSIVHFAGLGATRLSRMACWLDDLQRNQVRWEIPLENTIYGDDVSNSGMSLLQMLQNTHSLVIEIHMRAYLDHTKPSNLCMISLTLLSGTGPGFCR